MLAPIISAAILLISSYFTTQNSEHPNWFEFKPNEDYSASEIDMTEWLDMPAGKHGFLQMQGKDLVFENGEKVKFWGVNISSNRPFSKKEKADQWVKHLAKYGVNAVRFHKFTWHAYKKNHSTILDEEKYQRFDYFNHALREKGIYYGWSHIYGHKVKPQDSTRLLAYEEIKNLSYPWSHLNGTTSSLINFAEDLQELSIELTVGMLEHTNPHTGLRYADDPALIFIEMQNEDNIFWSAIGKALEQAPTYKSLLCEQFSNWLKAKYGNTKKLQKAWGEKYLPDGQSIGQKNIFPEPNHSLFSYEYAEAYKTDQPIRQDILDKMQFLHEKQLTFYKKFEKAIRATGYKGVLVGSCWQAGMGPSHYYNLHADYQTGMIDRHNYWGGGTGHRLKAGKVKNTPMLSRPGSGILSTGMQQVLNRPFSISEWMCLMPNEWTTEGVPLVALYGMGLQGWDASFHFGSDVPHYTETLHTPGVYNVESPTQLALYPAVARMIYRNDIEEGEAISVRKVHVPSLNEGELGFYETIEQGYDDKFITGDVPAELLAAGKVAVEFTESEAKFTPPTTELWDRQGKTIRSNTKELYWDYSEKGYVTANTANSKAVIGFTKGKEIKLGGISIKTDNEFAVIFITALEKDKSLADSKKILVTTLARAANTGMRYNSEHTEILEIGEAPILLEPVNVSIDFSSVLKSKPTVHVLDHVGRKTKETIAMESNTVDLTGNKTKAIYYLLKLE